MKKLMMSFLVLIFCGVAHAQFVFSPGLSYTSSTDAQTTPLPAYDSEVTELIADLRLGYVFPMGFYLGALYTFQNSDLGSNITQSKTALGPTIGYYNPSGFNLLFTYHLMADAELDNNGTVATHTGGSGMQFDIGWNFPITSVFGLGPQFTYRSIEYADYELAGNTVTSDRKTTDILPYLALWFMF